jgi:hypothetical protein
MPGKTKRTAPLVRTKVGDVKDPEINGNYNRTAVEDGQRKPEAYEANTMKIIRHLICPGRRGDTESRSDAIGIGSDIRSGSETATRL